MAGLRSCLALVLALVLAPTAYASSLGSADKGTSATVRLTEYPGLNISNRGAEQAEGVVYFIDGLDPSRRVPDDFRVTYPYLSDLNGKFGWDVVNAKYPNAENDIARSVPKSLAYVQSRLEALKAKGYRRIVIGGQSWGGWIAMEVARRNTGTHLLDGLVMVAPAAYGARTWQGADNPYYLQNLTEYIHAIKTVRVPTIAVFFEGDPFDPGDRGAVADALYARSGTPLLLIDQPKGLDGHGAGWLPPFADRYGACIDGFLRSPSTARCPPADQIEASAAPRDGTLPTEPERQPVGAGQLDKRAFIMTTPSLQVQVLRFGGQRVEVAAADTFFDAEFSQKNEETCVNSQCFRVYDMQADRYIAFSSDGKFAGWLVPVR